MSAYLGDVIIEFSFKRNSIKCMWPVITFWSVYMQCSAYVIKTKFLIKRTVISQVVHILLQCKNENMQYSEKFFNYNINENLIGFIFIF